MAKVGRGAVLILIASALLHLSLASQSVERSPGAAVALAGMGVACLICLPSLWAGGSLRTWMTMLGLTGAMLLAHWEFCFACGPEVHQDAGLHQGPATRLFGQGLASLALWLMVAEMALAATAVVRLLNQTRPIQTTNPVNQPEVAQP